MHRRYVIVGGGVAGLSAAISLAELGESPLIIEGGNYPSHKVCGEFLSSESLELLKKWGIHTSEIENMVLKTAHQDLNYRFRSCAGGLSHLTLDTALLDKAISLGAEIKTNTEVISLTPKNALHSCHTLVLSSGESLEALHLVIATGKIPSFSTKPEMKYKGFKAHFTFPHAKNNLTMFSLPGFYMGVSPVEGGYYNVACLAEINESVNFPNNTMTEMLEKHVMLKEFFSGSNMVFDQWMTATVPEFGFKKLPDWEDAYFIGDAALTVPPACGNGLSLALLAGQLVSEYAVQERFVDFKKMWKKRCQSQLFWAKLLHKVMLRPKLASPLMRLCKIFPTIPDTIFKLTRQ